MKASVNLYLGIAGTANTVVGRRARCIDNAPLFLALLHTDVHASSVTPYLIESMMPTDIMWHLSS